MEKVVIKTKKIKNEDEAIKIEKELKKIKEIKEVEADEKENTIQVEYNNLTINQIEEKIEELGYTSLGVELTSKTTKKSKTLLIVIGVLLTILLSLSICTLLKLSFVNIISTKMKTILLYIATIIFLIWGLDILIDGIKSHLQRKNNLNSLVSLTIIFSFIYSSYKLIMFLTNKCTWNNYTYLEIIIFLIYFKKIGDYLVSSNRYRIDREIDQLSHTNIKKVTIKDGDILREISLENVRVNDKVICLPGDLILVDGTVTKGYSHTAEALINGKSTPIEKEENTIVISGSMNCENNIEYTVDRLSKDSYVSNIKKLVAAEKNNKEETRKRIDRYSSHLLPTVLVLAMIGGILAYLKFHNLELAFTKGITILLISCPFGLALTSPISFRRTIKSPANKGILIKSIKSLEKMKYIDTIVFDKTGTLTNGYLCVSRINNHSDVSDKELLELLGSIEKHSIDPTARGINKYLRSEKIKSKYDFVTEDLKGFGIKAKDDKDLYYACNSELLKKLDIINSYKEEERKMRLDGNDVIYLVKNTKVIATFGLKDIARRDVVKVINSLKEKKYEIIMITGDDKINAERISKELGIKNVICDMSAIEKRNYIKKLMDNGKRVMMIGDGINDAISLACADIGVALKNSLDIPTASADIIITNGNLFKVLDLFNISRSTNKLVKENIFLSLIPTLVLCVLTLDMFKIKMNSVIIIIVSFISVLIVVMNTLRVKNK